MDSKTKKHMKLIWEAKEAILAWLFHVDEIGNECAYTDRMLEDAYEKIGKVMFKGENK